VNNKSYLELEKMQSLLAQPIIFIGKVNPPSGLFLSSKRNFLDEDWTQEVEEISCFSETHRELAKKNRKKRKFRQ